MAMVDFTYGDQMGVRLRQASQAISKPLTANFTIDSSIITGAEISASFTLFGISENKKAALVLCQTTATGNGQFTQFNTHQVVNIFNSLCINTDSQTTCPGQENGVVTANILRNFSFTLQASQEFIAAAAQSTSSYFLCFSFEPLSCALYSPAFHINVPSAPLVGGGNPIIMPASTISIAPPTSTGLSIQQTYLSPVSNTGVITVTSSGTTITPTPTITGTITSLVTETHTSSALLSSPTAASAVSVSKSSGLSTGAKVGIALGSLVIFALLLLGLLFCLRRKHAKRSAHRGLSPHQPPEQVMLTRSMHTDSFGNASGGGGGGRNGILAEKEEALASAAALNPTSTSSSPIHEPETRHSATTPYVPLPTSLPYSGTATTIPRRKPTSATIVSTVSRNISSASALSSGPISPRSQTTPRSDDFTPYHDVPIYGDARHSPQVFQGGSSGGEGVGGDRPAGSSSPFVTEEMSAEEVARLEEEERRIDAAIAESERR